MQHFNARKVIFKSEASNSGFTLIELMIVVVLVGILAAIGIPSILANLERSKMDAALTTIRGALEEAQKISTKKGKACDVIVDTTNKVVTSEPLDCLITGPRTLDKSLTIATNPASSPTLSFSFKGNTVSEAALVIYVTESPQAPNKRCLFITQGTGILRTGIYNSDSIAPIDGNKCEATL